MEQAPLKDQFGRIHNYLRISLTDKCNLRCFYCMPPEGIQVTPNKYMMSREEIFAIASGFVDAGVNKIRLTGGEPLVRKDAKGIIQDLSVLPVTLAITTNGILADQYIETFKQTNLRAVNVSLDSLNAMKFQRITRRDYFEKVWQNILHLLEENFHVKLNVVVTDQNKDELRDFVKLTQYYPLHVRFIEFMPFKGNQWQKQQVITYDEMLKSISTWFPVRKINDQPNDTAKNYQIQGFKGTFAIISSVTMPFCSTCNRMRLTADGKMRNCLFTNDESDILTNLRAGNDIMPLIYANVGRKKARTGGQDLSITRQASRSMIAIGG